MSERDESAGVRGETAARVRLQRVMADAGVASRRECEAMIERGAVEVNGRVVSRLPVFVDPSIDHISVDGRPLKLRRAAPPAGASRRQMAAARAMQAEGVRSGRVYIMLHKPDRVLCTTRDDAPPDAARTTVIDLLGDSISARVYPVGRLDYHSTGLVLLTNDGTLADRLTHARFGVTRTYRVTVKGEVPEILMEDLARRVGVRPDPVARPGEASQPSVRIARRPGPESANSVLEVTLREGRNRHLQGVLEQMGGIVRKLTRVGIGPLRLSGVAVGEWRHLTPDEVHLLKVAGGLIDELPGPATVAQSRGGNRSKKSSRRPGRPTRARRPENRA